MTRITDRIEDQLSEANAADVRKLNEQIRKTERYLAGLRRERDLLIGGFSPADSLDQESASTEPVGNLPDDLPEGHFDEAFLGARL